MAIVLGTPTADAQGTATLTLNPSNIAAKTAWAGMPASNSQSDITVTWNPPECVGTLAIVELDGTGGYTPTNGGTLTKVDDTHWAYVAFDEPQTEKCPEDVKVWIAAFKGEVELTRKSILVFPVHKFLITGANANFSMDYDYISWKYATVLATTGGAFTGGVTISTSGCVPCGLPSVCVAACTRLTDSVTFGTSAFAQSENAAASTIGHELAHTVGILNQSECTAYTWEFNNDTGTGIFQCDSAYLANVVQQMNCECNGIGCP